MSNATAVMTLHTNHGDIKLNLFGNHAPNTVKIITGLATGELEWTDPETGEKKENTPFYDGVVFHRIITDFMLQGGDRTGTGSGGPGFVFDDEIHPELNFNEPYVLAMANAGKMAGRGTNGSQFFITTANTGWLVGKHTIFGEVADEESKRVVDEIEGVETDGRDRPLDDVVIESVEVEQL
ncbi:peptidylprolyl isomerase [Gulosibacter molinativorax]|uniref:Peptidyl-prolyl cis-trans isomerase n=1 Tax=Gulosibacter molinativorax TaxID=256821 RepID=A0ABT7C7S2_9MICO|nr:peptidylprolyl isomerase [Gulosibacter molinativorax]MDJ1371260.1 peptidylprolyl isomerase [Gulosibacter molinativorax]QUY63076.1 Peptidyl-prolyl cis-trans isomerase [Gulosibacter molinativorax]